MPPATPLRILIRLVHCCIDRSTHFFASADVNASVNAPRPVQPRIFPARSATWKPQLTPGRPRRRPAPAPKSVAGSTPGSRSPWCVVTVHAWRVYSGPRPTMGIGCESKLPSGRVRPECDAHPVSATEDGPGSLPYQPDKDGTLSKHQPAHADHHLPGLRLRHPGLERSSQATDAAVPTGVPVLFSPVSRRGCAAGSGTDTIVLLRGPLGVRICLPELLDRAN